MSTSIIEVYEAFKADGRRTIKHRRTAKALADYEGRFNKLETQLGKNGRRDIGTQDNGGNSNCIEHGHHWVNRK